MKTNRSVVALCLVAVALLAQAAAQVGRLRRPDSPTDGLSMQLLMEGQAQQLVRYRFNGEGVLLFAGGQDVSNDRFSWEGVIPPKYGQAIAAAGAWGWFTAAPTGNGNESATWTISAWDRSGRGIHFTVYGEDDSVRGLRHPVPHRRGESRRIHEDAAQAQPRSTAASRGGGRVRRFWITGGGQ